jgi:diacylglycerol O-acyltransferase / wax synthase
MPPATSSPLTLAELANVWVDEASAPFQVALIGVFEPGPFRRGDGTLDVARVRGELTRRAGRVPELRRRIVWPGGGSGRPFWIEDPAALPDGRISVASLPTGVDLFSWCAPRIVRPLDLTGPPWRADIVDGLDGGRFALVIIVHHVLADGLTGVALAGALFDPGPDGRVDLTAEGPAQIPTTVLGNPGADRDGDRRAAGTVARREKHRARMVAGRLRRGWRQMIDAVADFRTSAPLTSLSHHPVGSGRRLATVRQPMDVLRAAGHQLGVTVNDLLLAAVTGGLRELLLHRDDQLPAEGLRASVPVGAGTPGQAHGILLVDLPVAEPDPLYRLAQIRDTTFRLKARLRSGGGDVLDVLRLPLPVARVAVRWMRRIAGRRINLFVTNVPGPAAAWWLAGARLVEAHPVAPLIRGLSLNVAALSYAGRLHVSVNADGAVTDLDAFTCGMERSFAALVAAARAGAALPAVPQPETLLGYSRREVENTIEIDRDPSVVFTYMTNIRREPDWNPQLIEVEQLTEGPIGVGTRFRMRFGHGVGDSTVTYVGFDPPHRWTAESTSRRLNVRFQGAVEPVGARSRLVVRTRLMPIGPLRPLTPLLRLYMHRVWNRNLVAVKAQLENRMRGEPDASRSGVREPVRQYP